MQNDAPITVNPTVRRPNADLRSREYLTVAEVSTLAEAAKANRQGHRDATMILMAFRHGLRAAELCSLRWEQVDFNSAVLHVQRVKGGSPSVHPLAGSELRALRRLQRESTGPWLFVSERGAPLSPEGFARLLRRTAERAGLGQLRVYLHMLRHACGFHLANDGRDTRSRPPEYPAYGEVYRAKE